MTSNYERPIADPAVEQDPRVQQALERFRHHDKSEHPPTDTQMGKTPARAEHEEEYGQNPLLQPEERRVKDAKKQADEYGREMNIPQTLPQTLIDAQDRFGASNNSDAKEPREKVSLFPSVERHSD